MGPTSKERGWEGEEKRKRGKKNGEMREGKEKGRGEDGEGGREGACPTNKKSFPHPCTVYKKVKIS